MNQKDGVAVIGEMLSIEQIWGSRPWLSVLNILDLKILSEQLIFEYEVEKVISAADINMDVILKFIYSSFLPPNTEIILMWNRNENIL